MKNHPILHIVFVLAFCLTAGTASSQDLKSKVEEAVDKMKQAMMDQDYETLLGMYAEDAVSLPAYAKMLKGKDEIRSYMMKDMDSGFEFTEVNFETVEVREMGDQALEIGTYKMTFTAPGMTEPMSDEGKYLTVYNIQEDGSLKIAVDMWNSNNNPMTMTAGAQEME